MIWLLGIGMAALGAANIYTLLEVRRLWSALDAARTEMRQRIRMLEDDAGIDPDWLRTK